MLCVIIVVFVFCWTPFLTFNILQAYGVVHAQLRGFAKHLKTALTLMAYLNRYVSPRFSRKVILPEMSFWQNCNFGSIVIVTGISF
jgi:hypothetical protein